jgi:uncharacterized protein (DUF1330 family)
MPKGYWIGRVDVHDPQAYKAYMAANAEAFRAFGGRFVVRGGAFETREGESRARNVVIEFPTYEAAKACYESAVYQAALAHRVAAAVADVIIIEGYDGPQP